MSVDARRKPLTQGEIRTYVEDFDALRETIRETHVADNRTLLYVRVIFDGRVIVHTMGSTDLALAAITEALNYIAPLYVDQRSHVQIDVQASGRRWDGT